MSQAMNESELVRAARAGDGAARATLLDRHYPLLLTLCGRMLGDGVAAEDAAQEAVVQALVSLDQLRQPERFGSWLAGIGLNVCRRWLRRRAAEPRSADRPDAGPSIAEVPAPGPGPDELAEEAEMRERVRAAVAGLPPGQRAAVLLVYLGGLSLAEAAATLGVAEGAVKTRLFKARRSLRRDLGAGGRGPSMALSAAPAGWAAARVADVWGRVAPGGAPGVEHAVLLEEVDDPRRRSVWAVGAVEAKSLAAALIGTRTARPLPLPIGSLTVDERPRAVRLSRVHAWPTPARLVVAGPAGAREVATGVGAALVLALTMDIPIQVAVPSPVAGLTSLLMRTAATVPGLSMGGTGVLMAATRPT